MLEMWRNRRGYELIDPRVFYSPFPRQIEFHKSAAKYRLFGGAAGPGKTKALLWEAIRKANKYPKVDTLLLRRTFPELEESLIKEFRRGVPNKLYRNYNESKHIVTWHNGSTTRFGHCQSENDVYQYQGAEYLFIGLDELTHFTLKMWQFLTTRNRCPVPGTFPCMAGASNPGNIGHAFVKALFIDKVPPPGMEEPEKYKAEEYDFIKATLADNPVYANDEGYKRTLDALPKHLRRAFLNGDWDIFAGQYFSIFNHIRHTLDAHLIPIQPWWKKWGSIDWGFQHPASMHLHSRETDGRQRIFTYREEHRPGISEETLGRMFGSMAGADKLDAVYLSPDAFAKRGSANTVADQIYEGYRHSGLPYPTMADNDRVGGARLMYQLLDNDLWIISKNCPKLIETLPTLIVEEGLEDVLKVDATEGQIGDDAYDSARYGLKSFLSPGKKPFTIELTERLDAVPDFTKKHILHKMLVDQHGGMKPDNLIFKPRRAQRQFYA